MAAGDFTLFEEFTATLSNDMDLAADTWKVAALTSAVAPTAADATPALGDYTQVTPGGNYVAGGYTLTATFTEAGGTATFDSDDPTWAQNASNPTNARYLLLYNDTSTTPAVDTAAGFVDLGGVIDMSLATLTFTVHANGWFTVTNA